VLPWQPNFEKKAQVALNCTEI